MSLTRTTDWDDFRIHGVSGTNRLRPMKIAPRTIRGDNSPRVSRLNNALHGDKIDRANARKGGMVKVPTILGHAYDVCRELPNGQTVPIIATVKPCKCLPGDCTHTKPFVPPKPTTMQERIRHDINTFYDTHVVRGITHDPKTNLRYSSADLYPTPKDEVIPPQVPEIQPDGSVKWVLV